MTYTAWRTTRLNLIILQMPVRTPILNTPQSKGEKCDSDTEETDNFVAKLRGVEYNPCIQTDNPVLSVDKITNVVPEENKMLVNILMDDDFE